MINNVQRELFSIDVDVLSFKIYLDNNNYCSESSCVITNLTDDYIAFRTKTTKKERGFVHFLCISSLFFNLFTLFVDISGSDDGKPLFPP